MILEITGHPNLEWLHVTTPGQYAIDLAIEVLEHLDKQQSISVKNTGWKNGFGLAVCEWTVIYGVNCEAELMTDTDTFEIRKSSESKESISDIITNVKKSMGPE